MTHINGQRLFIGICGFGLREILPTRSFWTEATKENTKENIEYSAYGQLGRGEALLGFNETFD